MRPSTFASAWPERQEIPVAVDPEENVSLMNDLIVVNQYFRHEAGHVRSDGDDVCSNAPVARPGLKLIVNPKLPPGEHGETGKNNGRRIARKAKKIAFHE